MNENKKRKSVQFFTDFDEDPTDINEKQSKYGVELLRRKDFSSFNNENMNGIETSLVKQHMLIEKIKLINDENIQVIGSWDSGTGMLQNYTNHNIDGFDISHHNEIFTNIDVNAMENLEEILNRTKSQKVDKNTDLDKKTSPLNENIPLYKIIKSKQRVLAKYKGDEKYYPAIIKSVIHGGYLSATYDVQYEGYNNVENISWRDIMSIIPTSDHLTTSLNKTRLPPPPPIPPRIKNLEKILVKKNIPECLTNADQPTEKTIDKDPSLLKADLQTEKNLLLNSHLIGRKKGGWKNKER